MPELPDLEIFSENLTKRFASKRIKNVNIINDKKINVPKVEMSSKLEGKIVERFQREGKELHLKLSDSTTLGLHLMLKGQLSLLGEKEVKHKIIEIVFDDATGLILSDFMGQATPTLNPEVSAVPDALSNEFKFTYLKPILSKSKLTIKQILLDQKIVRGIGNAYADEILYDAKVSPFSVANKIPDDKIEEIISSSKSILLEAIQEIKKTHPELITGEVRTFLKVHVSGKEMTSSGEKINYKEVNSKKTYFVDGQVEYF